MFPTAYGYHDAMKEILLKKEPVALYKVLKFEGLASSGGHAKAVIAEGKVMVNGIIETQKRKKLVAGDVIEIGAGRFQLALEPGSEKSGLVR